jgi:hypothetical protein
VLDAGFGGQSLGLACGRKFAGERLVSGIGDVAILHLRAVGFALGEGGLVHARVHGDGRGSRQGAGGRVQAHLLGWLDWRGLVLGVNWLNRPQPIIGACLRSAFIEGRGEIGGNLVARWRFLGLLPAILRPRREWQRALWRLAAGLGVHKLARFRVDWARICCRGRGGLVKRAKPGAGSG